MKLIILIVFLYSLQSYSGTLKGIAESTDKEKFEYTEIHSFESDEQGFDRKLVTRYYDKDGKMFAEQSADFTKDLFAPELSFTDFRTGTIETVTVKKDLGKILFSKSNSEKKLKSDSSVALKSPTIVGPGFNNFILKNFDKLIAGETLEVYFVVLARQDFYRFDISSGGPKNGLLTITIEMHNFILKRFVKELKLVYEIKDRKLRKFVGLSNLTDQQGQVPQVNIDYE